MILHFAEIDNQSDDASGLSGAGQRQFNIGIEVRKVDSASAQDGLLV
ncbi:MAG: hypothetical protein PGN25_21910 [Methylorubrum populi]